MGTIFWDFDGTLVKPSPSWRKAMIRALDATSPGHSISMEMLSPLIQKGFPWHANHAHGLKTSNEWWEYMNKKFAADYETLGFAKNVASQAAELIRSHILDITRYQVYEDTRATLNRLSLEGWRHLILSNNHPDLEELMCALDLNRYFIDIITSGKVGFEKPRSEIFHHALEKSGSKISESWMVGDNIVADFQGAEAIGLRAILVRSTDAAHRQAKDLNETAAIILAE